MYVYMYFPLSVSLSFKDVLLKYYLPGTQSFNETCVLEEESIYKELFVIKIFNWKILSLLSTKPIKNRVLPCQNPSVSTFRVILNILSSKDRKTLPVIHRFYRITTTTILRLYRVAPWCDSRRDGWSRQDPTVKHRDLNPREGIRGSEARHSTYLTSTSYVPRLRTYVRRSRNFTRLRVKIQSKGKIKSCIKGYLFFDVYHKSQGPKR